MFNIKRACFLVHIHTAGILPLSLDPKVAAASPVLTSTGKELELPDDGSASGWTDGDGDGSSAEVYEREINGFLDYYFYT